MIIKWIQKFENQTIFVPAYIKDTEDRVYFRDDNPIIIPDEYTEITLIELEPSHWVMYEFGSFVRVPKKRLIEYIIQTTTKRLSESSDSLKAYEKYRFVDDVAKSLGIDFQKFMELLKQGAKPGESLVDAFKRIYRKL